MRMGTFLLGGIAGAAAVVYLRNRKNWMFGSFMNSAASNVADKKTKSSVGTKTEAGLDRVQSIVNEDAELKQQVSEIIAGSAYDKESTASVNV